jgi:hypothetical protein
MRRTTTKLQGTAIQPVETTHNPDGKVEVKTEYVGEGE